MNWLHNLLQKPVAYVFCKEIMKPLLIMKGTWESADVCFKTIFILLLLLHHYNEFTATSNVLVKVLWIHPRRYLTYGGTQLLAYAFCKPRLCIEMWGSEDGDIMPKPQTFINRKQVPRISLKVKIFLSFAVAQITQLLWYKCT